MRIAFNPSTVAALTSPPNNKDITFDLRGQNIFARGVKFYGTDTNTWRDIKINNVSIGSHTLDLRNGSNTTLTNTNGVVTINSTWRPVVDSLTSDSTTSSLSANQGRVLKSLIDGKSDSGHNHDNRYLKLTGGTMLGALNFANNTWNKVGDDVYMGDHNIRGQLCIMGANNTTGLSFHKYGDASIRKSITFDGNTLYMNGSCDYATLSNQTNLLAMNTVPNKTAATSIGSWSPISGRYVFHQKWTDTSTGGDTANFGIYLDGNLTANMVLDGYYNSLLGFRVIGASGGFLKANGTIDNSTYLTSHQSLSNYYTKGEIDNQLGKYKLKSSIWVPETKVICSNFRDFLNKENLHKQAYEELNLYRFFADGDESNYSSKYNYPVVDSHAMVFSIDGNNGFIRSMNFDLRSNNVYVTSRVVNGEWRSWDRLLNTSDIAGLKNDITLHQYLSNTNTTWWPLVWGGSSHNNTSDSTGAVCKSHDKLSWQTSSQTLYATNIQTENIKRLSIGGGIFWNPNMESATDSTDAASITLVKSGVAGGTTLVLSQMNDASDTIQFKTNTAARLYHNSYPILTTQNTYVNNHKGYIYGAEITQVNNSDTVDGEHASSFVRAGTIEVGSPDLNALDTYSFIKSVNSQVADHSPKGNIGWYNVIQLVHRNGVADGTSYIGQIALGMTTNLSAMFYRTKNGSWYAWNEVLTTNTGLLRYSRNNVNISSPNCSPIPPSLLEWTVGYPRLYDPEFNEGDNNVQVYNNANNGVVTVTRVHDTNVGNSSSYVMKVVSASGASPYCGGWNVRTQTELGKVYTCLFRASIPYGVEIEFITNSIGSGGDAAWLTNNMGTGKWTWYAMQVYCGSRGSTTFFFSAKSPCTWYLSYVNVIENNRASYAGLRSVYSDYLKQNTSLVFGRNELQYFNWYTDVTSGAKNNATPTTDWYHILRMNHANNSGYFVDLAIPFNNNRIQFRRIVSGSDNGWRRVITEEPNHDVILREANTSGNVGIGINNPAYKLDVNGQIRASGFHHSSVNSDNYMLLAGGGYKSFGGDDSNPIFLGYLNLYHGNDGTISSSFSCLGYSVPFTYTRGGNYCRIYIPDTTHQVFYIRAATASVNYSGGGMDTWTGGHRGTGAWWLHCYAYSTNEIRVKGFCQNNSHNDSWWGGNPLWSNNDGANKITVCIFGYVKFR